MAERADYILATGRLRVKESKLIDTEAILRMLEAQDAVEAFKVLADFDYSDELAKEEDPNRYEEVLDHDLKQTKEFILEAANDPFVLSWLFSEYDFHNMKCFFKEKYFEKKLDDYLSTLGNVDSEKMRQEIIDEADVLQEGSLKEAIFKARDYFSKESEMTPEVVDSYLDKLYYSHLKQVVKKIDHPYVKDSLKKRIDLANIKIMIRAKKLGKDFTFVEKRLILGGSLNVELYKSRFEEEEDEAFFMEVSKIFVNSKVEEGFKEAVESKSFFKIEKAFEDYEAVIAEEGRKKAFGLEVLLSYLRSKEIAQRNIRKIMIGKINGIPAGEIKERLIGIL